MKKQNLTERVMVRLTKQQKRSLARQAKMKNKTEGGYLRELFDRSVKE
jgi:hypothetical protein